MIDGCEICQSEGGPWRTIISAGFLTSYGKLRICKKFMLHASRQSFLGKTLVWFFPGAYWNTQGRRAFRSDRSFWHHVCSSRVNSLQKLLMLFALVMETKRVRVRRQKSIVTLANSNSNIFNQIKKSHCPWWILFPLISYFNYYNLWISRTIACLLHRIA